MNPWILLAIGVAWAGSLAAAYNAGTHNERNACEAETAREERIGALATQAAASATAQAISRIEVKHVVQRQVLEREVRTQPVYTDAGCNLTPGGLRSLNAALAGPTASEPAGAGELPGAPAAGR